MDTFGKFQLQTSEMSACLLSSPFWARRTRPEGARGHCLLSWAPRAPSEAFVSRPRGSSGHALSLLHLHRPDTVPTCLRHPCPVSSSWTCSRPVDDVAEMVSTAVGEAARGPHQHFFIGQRRRSATGSPRSWPVIHLFSPVSHVRVTVDFT